MMKEKTRKKLLVLGGSNAEVGVVDTAHSLGCYVIVTDYYTDANIIPAKFRADEAWNISWSDYDTLEAKCREAGVQGIIAGFSEFRVESMIEMCRRLSLPCYINTAQLDVTRDKNKFKEMCRKYGVPTVKEYAPDSSEIEFPVIIKPSDRGGSIGINVAYSPEEFRKALEYAYSLSPSKNVVVEEYIGNGVKFDCSYYIAGREAVLIETCDTTMLTKQKGFETMQKAWTFPSRHEYEYISQVDPSVKAMLSDLGMECGVANISFFYREGRFYVFETGFRLGGGHSYDYQRASHGIDYLACMIKYSLGLPFTVNLNVPAERGYAVTYNIYFRGPVGSVVSEVIGEDKVESMKETITYIPSLYRGYEVQADRPQRLALCTVYSDRYEVISDRIRTINETLKVRTGDGVYGVFSELTSEELYSAMAKY